MLHRRFVIIGFFVILTIFSRAEVVWAQLYSTTAGNTSFYSSTPAEDIRANNTKTQVALNTTSGEIAVRMLMREFVFPNKLMQEHFNENYMESEKYPTGTFSGKLDQLPDLSREGTYRVSATGTFTVHGVAKARTLTGTLKVANNQLQLLADFEVALADHRIRVPKIVFMKIAQDIAVKCDYVLLPKK
jgi:polyisoprenoid-binding protein YceI